MSYLNDDVAPPEWNQHFLNHVECSEVEDSSTTVSDSAACPIYSSLLVSFSDALPPLHYGVYADSTREDTCMQNCVDDAREDTGMKKTTVKEILKLRVLIIPIAHIVRSQAQNP